jgi:hypothetical protein
MKVMRTLTGTPYKDFCSNLMTMIQTQSETHFQTFETTLDFIQRKFRQRKHLQLQFTSILLDLIYAVWFMT